VYVAAAWLRAAAARIERCSAAAAAVYGTEGDDGNALIVAEGFGSRVKNNGYMTNIKPSQ
jgi:hypothetical protein